MVKKVGLGILAVLVVFLIYVGLQSPDYMITREVTINAPADKIFPYLNSAKLGEKWGPWLEVDPQTKMSYAGPESGVGSRANWESPGQMGTGSATIVESVSNQKVNMKLEYVKPMSMTQDSEYAIRASGAQSVVSWTVRGQNTFMGRVMCSFMNMDKMVGSMFEKGLNNLKRLLEKA